VSNILPLGKEKVSKLTTTKKENLDLFQKEFAKAQQTNVETSLTKGKASVGNSLNNEKSSVVQNLMAEKNALVDKNVSGKAMENIIAADSKLNRKPAALGLNELNVEHSQLKQKVAPSSLATSNGKVLPFNVKTQMQKQAVPMQQAGHQKQMRDIEGLIDNQVQKANVVGMKNANHSYKSNREESRLIKMNNQTPAMPLANNSAHPVHAQSHAQSEVMNFSNGEMKQQSLRKNTLSVDKAKKDFSDVLKAGLEGKESGVAAALASSLGTAERASANGALPVMDISDLSNIQDQEQLIDQISNYIAKNSAIHNDRVQMSFRHEALGQIDLKVLADKAQDGVQIQITPKQLDGLDFFGQNKESLVQALGQAGIKVSELKLEFEGSKSDSSFNQNSGHGQSEQRGSFRDQAQQDSQRRRELWESFYNRDVA